MKHFAGKPATDLSPKPYQPQNCLQKMAGSKPDLMSLTSLSNDDVYKPFRHDDDLDDLLSICNFLHLSVGEG